MREKVLSVFVDESGDFGQYNPVSPYYYVAMVLHDQEIDISKNIYALETQVTNWGYPEHTIHTGPLIRRESVYKNDLREDRKALFNALYHFTHDISSCWTDKVELRKDYYLPQEFYSKNKY